MNKAKTTFIPSQVYEDYKPMIHNFAWKHHKKTGIELEELVSQGNLIFCEAFQTYNPNKAQFQTYLHNSLHYNFIKFLNKKKDSKMNDVHIGTNWAVADNAVYVDKISQKVELEDLIDRLSGKAKEVVKLALEYPKDMKRMHTRQDGSGYQNRISKNLIQRYLLSKGWRRTDILNSFNEIKEALT